MGKIRKISEAPSQEQRRKDSGCLTTVLLLAIFIVLLGAYALHQLDRWRGVNYKLPVANNMLDELQKALAVYSADSDMDLYPVGELSFYELTEAVSPNFRSNFDPFHGNILSGFIYVSRDGAAYKITAQLDTGVEVILTRTPDDLQR